MAWNSTKRRTNSSSSGRTKMRNFFLVYFVFCFNIVFLVSCKKNEENHTKLHTSNSYSIYNTQLAEANSDKRITIDTLTSTPIELNKLISIFPKKIQNFSLLKVNKGSLYWAGKKINMVSSEYISELGPISILCFDYLDFKLLPEHIKKLFDPLFTKNNTDVFFINENVVGIFRTDKLSDSKACQLVYQRRFYIEIECYNVSIPNEVLLDIVTSLKLNQLKGSN